MQPLQPEPVHLTPVAEGIEAVDAADECHGALLRGRAVAIDYADGPIHGDAVAAHRDYLLAYAQASMLVAIADSLEKIAAHAAKIAASLAGVNELLQGAEAAPEEAGP